jgi:hypothetical protein
MFDPNNPVTWQASDSRSDDGALLCICGTRQAFYSCRFRRGVCSQACWDSLDKHEGDPVPEAPAPPVLAPAKPRGLFDEIEPGLFD